MAKSKADLGKEAADYARKQVLKKAKKAGVTTDKVMLRLNEALDATETKVFNDTEDGIVYSEPLIAHQIRLKAVDLAIVLLDLKPAEKRELSGSLGINPVNMSNEELDLKIKEGFDKLYRDSLGH